MYAIGTVDRSFLGMPATQPPITGFFLDFRGTPPPFEALARRVEQRAGGLPALTHLLPGDAKRWWPVRTGAPDLAVHLRHQVLPAGDEVLADACDTLLSDPLPGPAHPQWDCRLLTQESAPDRFRLCFRIHHAFQDGVGGAYSTLALFADDPADGPRLYPAARASPATMLRIGAQMYAPLLSATPGWAGLHPPADDSGRRWNHHDVPTARLRDLAETHHANVNDVCLAALSLALKSWDAGPAPVHPPEPAHLLAVMSTRQPHERHAPGNRIGGYRIVLPGTATTLDAAVADVRRQSDVVRRGDRRDAFRALLGLPALLCPGPTMLRTMLGRRVYPLAASSITFPETFGCFGARFDAASMFVNVGDASPVYVSFTRTPTTVRCTVVADRPRARAITIPQHWARVLTGGTPSASGFSGPAPYGRRPADEASAG
ncbi:wax ester/triacylglycerol synthase domain-containing protein [Embleya sp. NPDC005971]|uniref:wax ester/triacylglycerol synthase domain-containing protein n=1 Tax=Embleya sp. NPDC005971 TaxID=3156724 RepID=UPI0033D8F622